MSDIETRAGKYLTFVLRRESYGIEILRVQEIIGLMEITRVPRTPDFMRGVINLRGKVIPVLDLRLKFALEGQADTEKTCIIVVQVKSDQQAIITIGILVDEVSEVLNIEKDQLEDSPSFGDATQAAFILGVAKVGIKVIMLLDVNKMLSEQEIKMAANIK